MGFRVQEDLQGLPEPQSLRLEALRLCLGFEGFRVQVASLGGGGFRV